MTRPRLWYLFVGLVLIVASACQVDVTLDVAMASDGSGAVAVEVALDPEAAARVPDLATELQTGDLTDAGWVVTGPDTAADGSVALSVSKPFANPDEGTRVLAEVAGADGPFSELVLSMSYPFGRTTSTFTGSVEFTDGVRAFAEEELTTLLSGQPFGGNLDLLEVETGLTAEEQTSFTVNVALPGASDSWTIDPADPTPEQLSLSGSEIRAVPVVLAGLALLSVIVLIVLLVVRLVRRRRHRRRSVVIEQSIRVTATGTIDPSLSGLPEQDPQIEQAPPEADAVPPAPADDLPVGVDKAPTAAPPSRELQLVALDTMGVVFTTGADIAAHLADFVAGHGGTTDRSVVADRYLEATEGRLPVGRLWSELEVDGDPGGLSDEFLTVHHVRPGFHEFLERMRDRELPVACLANDVGEWARQLRATHKLDLLISVWLAAGDVGERLPGPALFERLRSTSGIEWSNTLFIGTDEATLAVARNHGLAAAWFVPDDGKVPADPAFPIVRSFDELGLG